MTLVVLISAILMVALSDATMRKKEISHYTFKGNGAHAYAEATTDCITTGIDVQLNDEAIKMGSVRPQASKYALVSIFQDDSCTGEFFQGKLESTGNISISFNKFATFSLEKTNVFGEVCDVTTPPDCNSQFICTTKTIDLSMDVTWTPVGSFDKHRTRVSIEFPGHRSSYEDFAMYRDASVTMDLEIDEQDVVPTFFHPYFCNLFKSNGGNFTWIS